MKLVKVALSAGHYRQEGKNPKDTAGVYNAKYDLYEHDVCKDIMSSCFSRLCASKVLEPCLIEPAPLWKKAEQIEAESCDIALEVHLNYYTGKHPERVSGIETVYEDGDEESKKLATLIQGQLVMDMNSRDRGLLSDNEVEKRRGWSRFYIFDKMDKMSPFFKVPVITILTEVGFLSNEKFAEECSQDYIQPLAGRAIVSALESYVENFRSGEDI